MNELQQNLLMEQIPIRDLLTVVEAMADWAPSTKQLDSLTEHSIFQALPQVVRGKTLFIIAHRLSTVQGADRILLLNESRLVAAGTHAELLAGNAYYRSLVANQQVIDPLATAQRG